MNQSPKFNQFCESVLDKASETVIEARGKTFYMVAPTVEREGLIGYENLVANFTDEKPATAEEIIDVIQRNSEEPDNHKAAVDVFRELIDSNFLSAEVEKTPGEFENEPKPEELKDEPEVVDKKEEIETGDEEEKEEGSPLPPPEEDEADTFERDNEEPSVLGKDESESEEEEDDIPASTLLKKEREKKTQRSSQMVKMITNLLKRRGKSDEEIGNYLNHYQTKGLV